MKTVFVQIRGIHCAIQEDNDSKIRHERAMDGGKD